MTYSRNELLAFVRWIQLNMPYFESGSTERQNARITIANIRYVLARRL